MKKLIQTRLHNPPEQQGNCYPTVIACFLDLDKPEDVVQFQELYGKKDDGVGNNWAQVLDKWLKERGYKIEFFDAHLHDDSFYFVSGYTKRGTYHICIYQNGKLYHDPHPDQSGLVSESQFERIVNL